MNWILPDRDPSGLPLALWVLQSLLLFTFILHVLVMNVVLAGGPLALWALWRGRAVRGREAGQAHAYAALAAGLGRVMPLSTAFAITTGVAPLLFVQVIYGQVFYTSSVLSSGLPGSGRLHGGHTSSGSGQLVGALPLRWRLAHFC